MAGRIPQTFINDLLTRVDLVSLIDSKIGLKKAGRNYTACCPFHNEKTPSFSVNPDKQFYYCFGCGASGNAISFLMEYEGQEFVNVVEDLASSMGLEIPREAQTAIQPQYTSLFSVMEKVSNYYQHQLKSHNDSAKAINYLKKRGLSGEIAKQYGIGYAPNEWQNLNHLSDDQAQLQKDLVSTGMMIQKDNGHTYDRFRDRIMFPIRNRRGQVIGFGGRVIDQGEPKYLNSPETTLFHKGKELYGIYEMRRELRQIDAIIVVEGYMDVVALAQYGIANAVATLGTATTSEHLQTLFRICPTIVLCFDGDRAGRAAAMRAIEHALPLLKDAREVRLIFLPDGEDPDSMVRSIGQEAFNQQVSQAMTLFDYLFSWLTDQVDMNTFEGPAKLIHLAKPYLTLIQDPLLKTRFEQRLAELAELSDKQLQNVLQQNDKAEPVQNQSSQPTKTQAQKTAKATNNNSTPFRRVIALLLQYPNEFPNLEFDWLEDNQQKGADVLLKLCRLITKSEVITTAMLIEHWRGQTEEQAIVKLAALDLVIEQENVATEISEIMSRLKKNQLVDEWDKLVEKSKNQPLDEGEKKRLKDLQIAISVSK
jgi:DNA primase